MSRSLSAFSFGVLALGAWAYGAPVSGGLQLWLDSSDSSTVLDDDGDNAASGNFDGTVQTWQDKSGNSNHASALNAGQLPVYAGTGPAAQPGTTPNGHSVITFNRNNTTQVSTNDVEDQAFALTSNIALSQETMFFVTRMFDNGNNRGVWVGNPSSTSQFLNDDNRYFWLTSGNGGNFNAAAPQTFSVVTETRDPATQSGVYDGRFTVYDEGVSQGTYLGTPSFPATQTLNVNRIANTSGSPLDPSARYFHGQMGEVLIYNTLFNTAQRVITENYLSSKHDIALAANDRYAGDTAGSAHHDFDVFGIGQDVATTLSPAGDHTASSGDAISLSELNTSLGDGEYLLAGHDTTPHGTTTADLPPGYVSRWSRDYFLDFTTAGSLDARLTFDFAAAGLASPDPLEDYTLLFRAGPTGPFADLGLTGLVSGSTVAFDLLGFNELDDGFYAVAVVPEPSSAIVIGGLALGVLHHRRRQFAN